MPRLRFHPNTLGSRLEETFLRLWRLAGGPELEREYRFDSERRWGADFAHLPTRKEGRRRVSRPRFQAT
jgi:hypothetical protein